MRTDYGVAVVRSSVIADAAALAPKLRAADLQEIAARSGREAEDVLRFGIEKSRQCYTVELPSGEIAAIFGVSDTPDAKLGAVWMLGSDSLLSIRLNFLRHSRGWVDTLFKDYLLLGNFVDERNTVHIQWLRWLGFRFLRRVPLGRNGEVFLEFVRLKEPDSSTSHV